MSTTTKSTTKATITGRQPTQAELDKIKKDLKKAIKTRKKQKRQRKINTYKWVLIGFFVSFIIAIWADTKLFEQIIITELLVICIVILLFEWKNILRT